MELNQNNKRLVLVDAIRGFALAGVCLVHMTEQYLGGPTPEGFMEGINGIPDMVVDGLIAFFIRGKFFALFSLLFGLSFSIQMASAAARGQDFSWRFLWRAVLLFGIGYVHQLFYRGDVLTIYALLTPFLIPFHKLNNQWLLGVAAICFLSVPRLIAYGLIGTDSLFGLESGFRTEAETAYFEAIDAGGLSEVMSLNGGYGMLFKMDFQLLAFGRFYLTFGYFLLGLWAGRMGLFKGLEQHLKFTNKIFKKSLLAMGLFLALTAAVLITAPQPLDFTQWHHVIGINVMDWLNLAMTAAITTGIILLYRKARWQKRLNFFSAYGRMALTNYLLQSLIGTFFFFSWGLGYLGQVRSSFLFLLAIVLITLQCLFSQWWLKRFKYGPVEWLWRCGTYLKWQPFLKKNN